MRGHLLAVLVAIATGCGETQLGPFQPLPIDTRFDINGNDAVIHIARDRHGVAHVFATTHRDLGLAQGYVMAHDRLPQMEMLRRLASGTLAEIYGVTDPSTIELDKQMRFHQLRRYAEGEWAEVQLRASPRDVQVADMLEQFATGVNTYVADQASGRWPLDPAIRDAGLDGLFAPTLFAPWTPVDSIAIMRLFTFAQSWTVPEELALTELDVAVRRTHPAAVARDLLAIAPIPPLGVTSTVAPVGPAAAATRPVVPDALLASARAFFAGGVVTDPQKVIGAHAFLRPFIGSNAMVVGGDYTREQLETTTAILAADMQLAPSNPATFYPMHQLIGGELPEDALTHNVLGLMLPGVPIVIAGTNGEIGWAPTVGTHDVNDVYLEALAGAEISRVDELIRIGNYGDISSSETMTYEAVAHGPLIPGHPADSALSVAYTGYAITHELSVLWELGEIAFDVDTANLVLRQIRHGPHFMLVDSRGGYAWSSYADVPVRRPEARAWSAASPDAAAPFFILDGANPAHEWDGFVPLQELPFLSALEPAIVIADSDPVAATADGDPLNQFYAGVAYGNGLRDARLRLLLDTAPLGVDEHLMLEMQHDTRSLLGERIKDRIAALLDAALPTVPVAQQDAVTLARDVLAQWTLETPIGAVAANANSGATLLFNTWMHYFVAAAIGDELAGITLDDDRVARIVYRLLIEPASLAQSATNEPLLCGAGGCRALVVQAAVDAVADLTADGSGAEDWRWGRRHALKLRTLFPDATRTLQLPREAESMLGFQLAGDMFSIDRTDGGWADTDFTPRTTVAYRMQLVGSPVGAPLVMRLELPSGTVLDTRDPHYRDLLETSYLHATAFDVPFAIDEINRFGESRWEIR